METLQQIWGLGCIVARLNLSTIVQSPATVLDPNHGGITWTSAGPHQETAGHPIPRGRCHLRCRTSRWFDATISAISSEKCLINVSSTAGSADTPWTRLLRLQYPKVVSSRYRKYIKDVFEPFHPASFHKLIPTLPWRAIATTNYDLIIERSYSQVKDRLQDIIVLKHDDERVDERLRKPNSLMYLKLHGCISKCTQQRHTADSDTPISTYDTERIDNDCSSVSAIYHMSTRCFSSATKCMTQACAASSQSGKN